MLLVVANFFCCNKTLCIKTKLLSFEANYVICHLFISVDCSALIYVANEFIWTKCTYYKICMNFGQKFAKGIKSAAAGYAIAFSKRAEAKFFVKFYTPKAACKFALSACRIYAAVIFATTPCYNSLNTCARNIYEFFSFLLFFYFLLNFVCRLCVCSKDCYIYESTSI